MYLSGCRKPAKYCDWRGEKTTCQKLNITLVYIPDDYPMEKYPEFEIIDLLTGEVVVKFNSFPELKYNDDCFRVGNYLLRVTVHTVYDTQIFEKPFQIFKCEDLNLVFEMEIASEFLFTKMRVAKTYVNNTTGEEGVSNFNKLTYTIEVENIDTIDSKKTAIIDTPMTNWFEEEIESVEVKTECLTVPEFDNLIYTLGDLIAGIRMDFPQGTIVKFIYTITANSLVRPENVTALVNVVGVSSVEEMEESECIVQVLTGSVLADMEISKTVTNVTTGNNVALHGNELYYEITIKNIDTIDSERTLVKDIPMLHLLTADALNAEVWIESNDENLNNTGFAYSYLVNEGSMINFKVGVFVIMKYTLKVTEDTSIDFNEYEFLTNTAYVDSKEGVIESICKIPLEDGTVKSKMEISKKVINLTTGENVVKANERLNYTIRVENIGDVDTVSTLIKDSLMLELFKPIRLGATATVFTNDENILNFTISLETFLRNGRRFDIGKGIYVEINYTLTTIEDLNPLLNPMIINIATVDSIEGEIPMICEIEVDGDEPQELLVVEKNVTNLTTGDNSGALKGDSLFYEIMIKNTDIEDTEMIEIRDEPIVELLQDDIATVQVDVESGDEDLDGMKLWYTYLVDDALSLVFKAGTTTFMRYTVKVTEDTDIDLNSYGLLKNTIFARRTNTEISAISEIKISNGRISVENEAVIYERLTVKTEAEFLAEIGVTSTNNEVPITSNFDDVVNLNVVGEYRVSLTQENVDSIDVFVIVVDTIAPIITADVFKLYMTAYDGVIKSEDEFLIDINASTDDGSQITTNFTDIMLNTVGSYSIELKAIDDSGNETIKTMVVVVGHTRKSVVGEKSIITADSFSIGIGAARGLTAEQAKSELYGKVSVYDIDYGQLETLGQDITTLVTVDEAQLAIINKSRLPNELLLTFRVDYKDEIIEREVQVVVR